MTRIEMHRRMKPFRLNRYRRWFDEFMEKEMMAALVVLRDNSLMVSPLAEYVHREYERSRNAS